MTVDKYILKEDLPHPMNYVGVYTIGNDYEVNDVYSYDGAWFRCTVAHTASAGTVPVNLNPFSAQIEPDGVTFSASGTVLGRKTSGAGDGEEVTVSELIDLLGTAERGDSLNRDASAWKLTPHSTAGYVWTCGGHGADNYWSPGDVSGLYRQAVINPQFQINQRAATTYTSATATANSDDTYLMDQWTLLSDGNDIVDVSPSHTTVKPTGAPCSLKMEVETANKKFGIVQFIENKDAIKFAGKTASLQFKAYTTTGKVVENVRAAILSWSSTADTITSDVVSSWGAEGTNPTWATNWTAENIATNLALVADTWTTYKIENVAIDTANMTNLAIVFWVDDTDCAIDDLLYIGDVQINEGPICLPFSPRRFADDLTMCQRFYQKSFPYTTIPAQAAGNPSAFAAGQSVGATTDEYDIIAPLACQMRITPTTIVLYSPGAANAEMYNEIRAKSCSSTTTSALTSPRQIQIVFVTSSGSAIGDVMSIHYTASAEL